MRFGLVLRLNDRTGCSFGCFVILKSFAYKVGLAWPVAWVNFAPNLFKMILLNHHSITKFLTLPQA
jgi:hypothetical protein